ncbi:putative pentatricopeptide repeat-containing protein At5g13230, mitochondrial [Phalaenopsis equestris]|uniref:putative pentatricopeptide repeat-containing protein At5g13230, mitochondrial n=1 Tax=Phalaenopsis equestris TaxID=78828 RepID=UPI0009E64D87|nr:putative pentatricopeptide repeat-containing protein At5g13230, mitochondrial [Phalaenopsis equestris]
MVIGFLRSAKCSLLSATRRFKPHFGFLPRRSFAANAAQLMVVEEESAFLELDSYAYARALKFCIAGGEQYRGKAIHCHVLKKGGCLDLFCWNILLNFYVIFDLASCAHRLFDEMPCRNMVSFVNLMQGYANCGHFSEATVLLLRLYREGHELNHFVFTTALKLFLMMDLPEVGHCLHASICKLGHDNNSFVGASLIEVYSYCGLVNDAQWVFDSTEKDIVVWTGMVSCFSENECPYEALLLFSEMMKAGFKPNNYTLTSLLKVSVSLSSLELGKSIHGCSVKSMYESDEYVGGALLDMYAKCGDIVDARLAFNMVPDCDVILWSFMIARYAQSNKNSEALDLFQRMVKSSVAPNEYSFSSVLQACANIGDLYLGGQVHCHVMKIGFVSEIFVANALMDVYAKCNYLEGLNKIFYGFYDKNDVSWNTVIVGYVKLDLGDEGLRLFMRMREFGIPATQVTYSSALRACASSAAFELVGQIHALVMKTPFKDDNVVNNSLIDSYSKCGNIRFACKVFGLMKEHDVISWNALISGFAIHGLSTDALSLFRKMTEEEGIKANAVTFVGLLSACSNMGLLDEGRSLFSSMTEDYCIQPSMEHYTCMVKLFGRSGQFDEAMKLIKEIPLQPCVMVWRALLGACLIHKNVDIGKVCAEKVLEIEPRDELTCVMLSNLYASAGRWDNVSLIRNYMRNKQVKKEPGISWIEKQGEVHSFTSGDMTHPDMRVISAMLEWLNRKIRKAGYVPDFNVVLHDVGDELKKRLVWLHSERLALAFGLVSLQQGSSIRIIKNLRFCSDCHTSFKLISKVVGRELIVRDMNRFHCFEGGICSCADYW